MQNFLEIVKIILEKYVVDTIISFVISSIVFLITPTDYWILQKMQTTWYLMFIAGCVFIIIQLIKKIKDYFDTRSDYKDINKHIQNEEEVEIKRELGILWNKIDEFPQEDRELIKHFVLNGNSPYIVNGRVFYPIGRLLNSEYIHSQEYCEMGEIKTQYKLNENMYQILLYSKNKYGRISNFEEV